MADGYVSRDGALVRMSRTNTRYWDKELAQWKAPKEADYYNGTQWIPFIRGVPEPGVEINGGGDSGRVVYYSVSPAESNQFYLHPMTAIQEAGYDAEATKASEGSVLIWMRRADDTSSTTRNIGFAIYLYVFENGEKKWKGQAQGLVYAGNRFGIRTSRANLQNGMFLVWNLDGDKNSGWQFWVDGGFTLEF